MIGTSFYVNPEPAYYSGLGFDPVPVLNFLQVQIFEQMTAGTVQHVDGDLNATGAFFDLGEVSLSVRLVLPGEEGFYNHAHLYVEGRNGYREQSSRFFFRDFQSEEIACTKAYDYATVLQFLLGLPLFLRLSGNVTGYSDVVIPVTYLPLTISGTLEAGQTSTAFFADRTLHISSATVSVEAAGEADTVVEVLSGSDVIATLTLPEGDRDAFTELDIDIQADEQIRARVTSARNEAAFLTVKLALEDAAVVRVLQNSPNWPGADTSQNEPPWAY